MYVPSAAHTPLHVISSQNIMVESNGFLVPQWGGILIRNDVNQTRLHYNVEQVGQLMAYYVDQLRILLGVTPTRIKQAHQLLVI